MCTNGDRGKMPGRFLSTHIETTIGDHATFTSANSGVSVKTIHTHNGLKASKAHWARFIVNRHSMVRDL